MLQSVEGVYRDGKIELVEPAPEGAKGKPLQQNLWVTFGSGRLPSW